MVYGAILEQGEEYYTDLRKVLQSIEIRFADFNWLITDFDYYPTVPRMEQNSASGYCWLSGNELADIFAKENIQWIWAVLSGFRKNIALEEILKFSLPFANGNPGFWSVPVTLQHPLASIEIVPWDSSRTLVISTRRDWVDRFRTAFPLSEDLAQYNTRQQ